MNKKELQEEFKSSLKWLFVLNRDGSEASDCEMHRRIEDRIYEYKTKNNYKGRIIFNRVEFGCPVQTLMGCIASLEFL